MSDNNYQEVIKNNKLFDGIPPQNLKFQFRTEQIIRKKEGEIIFQKGDESQNTYLVVAGRVKIKVYIENKSVKLNKSINDFFGEIEVLEDTYRRSAAVANTDCILYSLNKVDLQTFIEEYQEVNDNIIAYNKVEIPELQLSINADIFKNDTDKLYITPPHEEKISDELNEEPMEVKEEIIDPGEEESDTTAEEEHETGVTIEEQLSEMLLEGKNEEVTIEPEAEEPEVSLSPEEDLNIEGNDNTSELSEENEVEENLNTEHTSTETDDSEIVYDDENNVNPNMTNPESGDAEEETTISGTENITEETDESEILSATADYAEEVTEKTEDEIVEEESVSENFSGSDSLEPENAEDTEEKWVDINSQVEEIEIHDQVSENEKIRYEAEDQKLKYDDTEVSSATVLNAVKRINSSLDKHIVYSNIVREAVRLTEAQAGALYRVDPYKKILVTEKETEDGFSDVSYSMSDGLTGLAAETGEMINVREPIKDFRYSEDIDSIRGIVGLSLLCVPVKNDEGETIAVISLANSSSGKFSIYDEEKMTQLVPHIAQTLQFINGLGRMLDENKDVYLSTLTKFVADNIQTPVLTMKYYAGQIKKKHIPQDVRTVLSVLMDQADSVVDFLDSTLAFTENRNPLKIEKFSLQEVMDDALGLLAEYVESRNVGLYKKVESNISVKLDKKAFYQACHQIAKNACDAMGESGNVYITAKQSGDLVNIEFRDTGPGIPDSVKEDIFRPFKSFNKEKGTGLGLTIARKIIRDHGGELTVESNPERGATFIISLPVFDDV
jgi:signal transduction histidine kinase